MTLKGRMSSYQGPRWNNEYIAITHVHIYSNGEKSNSLLHQTTHIYKNGRAGIEMGKVRRKKIGSGPVAVNCFWFSVGSVQYWIWRTS